MNTLDALVRRVDEDRWLASRFAPAEARAKLIALYAVNYELAHVGESVREPGLGEIRLQWWRDTLDARTPKAHPALDALLACGANRRLIEGLIHMADARAADLQAAPFKEWADAEAYLDATAGALIRFSLYACGAGDDGAAFAKAAGRAWGFAGLLRAAPYWRAHGRSPTPKGGVDDLGLRDRAVANLETARRLARGMPAAAFPAYGYLAFARDHIEGGRAPLLLRQLKLVLASARGRF